MCMLFMNCNPHPSPDEYCLVLASIRDESFMRPTRTCQFWSHNPNIIGGMDLEPGCEGGTWLAMHRNGKIGVLLNVLQPIEMIIPERKRRGFLVVDYLNSRKDGPNYLASLANHSPLFNPFLLVTVDVKPSYGEVVASYLTNVDQRPRPFVSTEPAIFAFGNNLPNLPWIKTEMARQRFEYITSRNRKLRDKTNLANQLFEMMSDDTKYFPDEKLLEDGEGFGEDYLQGLSSVNVKMPNIRFGSRTQSVILIDRKGNVDYIEKTIQENALSSSDPKVFWSFNEFNFRVSEDSRRRSIFPFSRL